MQKIAISGLAAVAAVLGGAAVPTVAMAQPMSAEHPVTAGASGTAGAGPVNAAGVRTAEAAALAEASRITGAVRRAGPAWRADLATAAADAGGDTEPLDSCVFTVDCLAIGGSGDLFGSATGGSASAATATATATSLVDAARWNGSSWKGVGVTLPAGTKVANLSSLSCKGRNSCLVVGDYLTSTSDTAALHALALIYDGTSLKPTSAVPLPTGTMDVTLSGVSCVTMTYCVAIGQAEGSSAAFGEDGELTLVETWNGAKWTLHTAAETSGPTELAPTEVSCATTAFCVVAGDEISIGGTATSPTASFGLYFADWNGKALTTMKSVPAGSSAALAAPVSVSCATSSNCGVTGFVADVSGSASNASVESFTEIWNGSTWQLSSTPWPAGTTEAITLGISCHAAHSCEAVGGSTTDAVTVADPSFYAAAVSYNGTTGTLQALTAPATGDSDLLSDVSCLPWGTCVAVGDTGADNSTSPATMSELWSGTIWRLEPGF